MHKRAKGAKDQLLIDSMVMNEAKKRHKNLQMLWVDYKKAYDSVPHSWILECLRMTKAHPSLCKFVKCSMQLWKTDLTVNGNHLSTINIRCGIFQGDTFSPLLFILSLIPLSFLLRETSIG